MFLTFFDTIRIWHHQAREHENDAHATAAVKSTSAPFDALKQAMVSKSEVNQRVNQQMVELQVDGAESARTASATASDAGGSDGESFEFSAGLLSGFDSPSMVATPRDVTDLKDSRDGDGRLSSRESRPGSKPKPNKRTSEKEPKEGQEFRKLRKVDEADEARHLPSKRPSSSANKEEAGVSDEPSKKLRADTGAGAKERARAACEAKRAAFSDENLWNTKIKARAISQMQKVVEENISKLIADDSHEDYVNLMVDFPDLVQTKFDLFAEIRKNPTDMVKQLTDDALKVLASMNHTLIQAIILHIAAALLKHVEERHGRVTVGVRCSSNFAT